MVGEIFFYVLYDQLLDGIVGLGNDVFASFAGYLELIEAGAVIERKVACLFYCIF
jgi:hypothetical protein